MKEANINAKTTGTAESNKKYVNSMHRIGRVGSVISLIFMMGIPFFVAMIYNLKLDWKTVAASVGGLLAMFIPVAISEVLSYSPIFGSGSYIAFITGNVGNLKLPVAINALELSESQQSTDKGDAVVTVAVCISSIVTMLIIVLGVILLVPLKPVLTNPYVQTSTAYILPALLGSLAMSSFTSKSGKYTITNKLLAVVPAILVILIAKYGLHLEIGKIQGIAIIFMIPVTIFTAKMLYKKNIIKIFDRSTNEQEMPE
ncbi:MAG: hypothetical protein LBN09_01975 [Clostridioides sp.]|jgi:hypothetical protein|nr:hypothetical protein [Clostridioides sp.]